LITTSKDDEAQTRNKQSLVSSQCQELPR